MGNAGKISVSTGYLNIKDVFYHGSVTELPEYVVNQSRFRSVSSLQSQKEPMAAKPIIVERIEEKAEDEEMEEEDSSATSASRAIEIWRFVIFFYVLYY